MLLILSFTRGTTAASFQQVTQLPLLEQVADCAAQDRSSVTLMCWEIADPAWKLYMNRRSLNPNLTAYFHYQALQPLIETYCLVCLPCLPFSPFLYTFGLSHAALPQPLFPCSGCQSSPELSSKQDRTASAVLILQSLVRVCGCHWKNNFAAPSNTAHRGGLWQIEECLAKFTHCTTGSYRERLASSRKLRQLRTHALQKCASVNHIRFLFVVPEFPLAFCYPPSLLWVLGKCLHCLGLLQLAYIMVVALWAVSEQNTSAGWVMRWGGIYEPSFSKSHCLRLCSVRGTPQPSVNACSFMSQCSGNNSLNGTKQKEEITYNGIFKNIIIICILSDRQ